MKVLYSVTGVGKSESCVFILFRQPQIPVSVNKNLKRQLEDNAYTRSKCKMPPCPSDKAVPRTSNKDYPIILLCRVCQGKREGQFSVLRRSLISYFRFPKHSSYLRAGFSSLGRNASSCWYLFFIRPKSCLVFFPLKSSSLQLPTSGTSPQLESATETWIPSNEKTPTGKRN